MPATRLHLVRHGEVDNPNGVLYGRLPNFVLSPLGRKMAEATALSLIGSAGKITALYSSPLQRTLQSARPFSEHANLSVKPEPLIIEPTNIFEGKKVGFETVLQNPVLLFKLYNPFRPSWGEPYKKIAKRMLTAMDKAWDEAETGEVVMVSHQLPIWTVHLATSGKPLWHDPRSRRCELSSVTSFEKKNGKFVEVGYIEPAKNLSLQAIDSGAV